MPNCTEEIGAGKIDFGRVGRRVVEGCSMRRRAAYPIRATPC